MKVLFDTNVILDLLLDREPFANAAAELVGRVETGKFVGLLCATTVTTLFYLAAKTVGRVQAIEQIRMLLSLFEVAQVNRTVLENALGLGFSDFEDAVLHEAARLSGADVIVTRNVKDFGGAMISVLMPGELLAGLRDE